MDFFQHLTFDQATAQFFRELLIVLGIGFLLGLEREFSKAKDADDPKLFAGVRTFPLVAIMGYLSVYLARELTSWFYVAAFLSIFGMLGLAYRLLAKKGDKGGTSEFALLLCFMLGSLVHLGSYRMAVVLAVVITTILALKIRLHNAVQKLERSDIFSILFFVVISALVLPLLPDTDYGLYGVFNPYKIWLIVVIFVSLNFLAYFLNKYFDQKHSVIIIGILGGFASSTATTWFFSRQSRNAPESGRIEAAAIVLASSIMFPRLLIWLLLLNQQLLYPLGLPMLVFGVAGLLAGYWLSNSPSQPGTPGRPALINPINLKEAFFFAFIYIGIQLLVGFANERFGEGGVLLAAGISGCTDIDAITISMAAYGEKEANLTIASLAVLIAAFTNTLVKYGLCLFFGNTQLKRYTSYVFVPLFLLGSLYIIYLWLT